jgi:hypothetical protein
VIGTRSYNGFPGGSGFSTWSYFSCSSRRGKSSTLGLLAATRPSASRVTFRVRASPRDNNVIPNALPDTSTLLAVAENSLYMDDTGEAGVRPYIWWSASMTCSRKSLPMAARRSLHRIRKGDLWVAAFRDPASNVLGVWQRGPRD